jgi:hypothetical protein
MNSHMIVVCQMRICTASPKIANTKENTPGST